MSTLSEKDHLSPNDPLYYAPRSLRERTPLPAAAPAPAVAPPERSALTVSPPSIDSMLEQAVSDSLRRPLDPQIMPEPPGFVRELDRRIALVSVAGRFAAAVGVSALVALFFVIMVPASRQSDGGGSFSAAFQSLRTALKQQPSPQQEEARSALPDDSKSLVSEESRSVLPDDSKPLLPGESRSSLSDDSKSAETKSAFSEFQTILAPAQANLAPAQANQPVMTHEQSETLLQQFVQWHQKPASTP
jgi:hypothetical protein